MIIKKVISGGQTGADMGGLLAARECGIKTGGLAPNGFMTEVGPQKELLESFGLHETFLPGYLYRTEGNVILSKLTIIFVDDILDGGSKLTANFCIRHNKPFFIIDKKLEKISYINPTLDIINIAGNRESKSPGIEWKTRNYLINFFNQIKEK